MGGSSRDDTNTAANALALCRDCHTLVESHRYVAKVMGWLVPQGADPGLRPVIRHGRRVNLGVDGEVNETEPRFLF